MRLNDTQRVPPPRALVKYRARLERLKACGIEPAELGVARAKLPSLERRTPYAIELELVLRDYGRLLEGLLPDEVLSEP